MSGLGFRSTASALVAATLLLPAAAQAQTGGYGYPPGGYERGYDTDRGDRDPRGYADPRGYGDPRGHGDARDYADPRGYDDRAYDRGGYVEARGYDAPPPPPPAYGRGYGRPVYRTVDYGPRGYRCGKGTGGTIIGAIAGGLLGNGIAGRGDRGAGTIIGAGVGALAGRAIDRSC